MRFSVQTEGEVSNLQMCGELAEKTEPGSPKLQDLTQITRQLLPSSSAATDPEKALAIIWC